MKKRLLSYLAVFLFMFCLITSYGLYLLQKSPELLFNQYSIAYLSERLLPRFGVTLKFASLDLAFSRQSFWDRSVRIRTQKLHLQTSDLELKIPSFDGILSFHWHPKRFAITTLGPLQTKGLELYWQGSETTPASIDTNLEEDSQDLAMWQKMQWQGPIDLAIQTLQLKKGAHFWQGGSTGLLLQTPSPQNFTLELSANNHQGEWDGSSLGLTAISAQMSFRWDGQQFSPVSFGPLTSKDIKLNVLMSKADESKAEPIDWQSWLKKLEPLQIAPMHLDIRQLRYSAPDSQAWQGRVDFRLGHLRQADWILAAKVSQLEGLPIREASLQLLTQLEQGDLSRIKADLKAELQGQEFGLIKLNGRLAKDQAKSNFSLHLSLREAKKILEAQAEGLLADQTYRLNVLGDARGLHPVIPHLQLSPCILEGRWVDPKQNQLDSTLNCTLSIERTELPAEAKMPFALPKRQPFSVQGPWQLSSLRTKPEIKADLRVTMPEIRGDFYHIKGDLRTSLQAPLQQFFEKGKIRIEGGTQIAIDSFQKMVQELRQTPWEIPAPFHTLEGGLSCEASARIDLQRQQYDIPLSCQSRLASSSQSFHWSAIGHIAKADKAPRPQLSAEVNLEQIQIELPKISLGEPLPQILADKRLAPLDTSSDQTQGDLIDWQVIVKTPAEKPLVLVSKLLKEPLPINLDIQMSSSSPGPQGKIGLANYRLDVMKKKALVESLGLEFLADDPSPKLFGLLRFEDPDTKIMLRLSGTADRPFYLLESQPPRPSNELLSMILFGGRPDAMSDDNLRSIEQTRAAMIDGAIGLVSMFYLASTPIDSVGYNPYTGVFRARVQLGQGTSLFVGSDLEGAKQSISLRRRLSENWSFETGAETSEGDGKNKGLAMFKWGRRY